MTKLRDDISKKFAILRGKDQGEEDRSCQMATECWLGLLMGPDGNSTLRGRSWVSPNVVVGALAPKTTEGETEVGNIEYICM